MKWYLKQRTLGWIILLVWVMLWGYFNRSSCVKENKEPVAHAPDLGTMTPEPVLHINILDIMRSTLLKAPEITRLPPSPTAPEITRLPPSPTAPEIARLPPSPTSSDIRRPLPSPTEQASTEVEVTGRLKVDRRKALLYGKARKTKSSLTIGIPTLRRQGVDYLEKTIYSLITHSDASQQMSIVLVIFIVDMDKTWTRIRSQQLAGKYPKLIQSGFLQIVHPPDQSIYPDFTKLKRTYNDSLERVAWRSKQNIDYAYLFAYSQNISNYYLQLEDDVVAASNYYRDIVRFIYSNSNRFWYYLEVSHIGFIGKLIRSSDLGGLSEYIMLFFADQPCDLLLIALGKIKTQSKRIIATRSLFQHIGTVSSLPGKIQKIIDKRFKDSFDTRFKDAFGLKDSFDLNQYPRKRFYHTNPSANIDTNIEVYSHYKPVYAYDLSNTFFWGVSPRRGGNFRVIFDVPQNISRIFIDSGITGKDTDILYDGKLLVSSSISNEERTPCQNFTSISKFENGDIDTSKSNISLPVNIDCIVIAVMANQTDWLVIREIAIFLPGELETTEPSNPLSQKPSKERMMIGKDSLEKSDALNPHLVHRNSTDKPIGYSGRHTVFTIRGHNKQYQSGHTDDHVSYPPYRGVTVNLGDKDVKHFERESDVKHASDMNQTTTSRVQHPFEQHYDNVTQRDDTKNIYNSTGVNKYSRKRFYHVNPPATVYTQIETFSGYKPVYAYDLSHTFFWGSNPKRGDYFLILLKSPQNISRIFIDSGSEGKESDILQNARLLISTRTPDNEERACQKLGAVALFVNGDVDTKISNISLPVNIDCITIEITANQNDWIIIREIAVFLSGELESSKLDQITSSPQMREERKVLVQTFKRNETLKRLFVSKQSLGSVQTKNPDSIKSQWQDPQGHTDSRHSNLNQPKESLDRRPYVSPNHRQINVHDANDAKNRSETLFKNGYAIDRNKLLKNERHHRYQPTSDSRFNNSEVKRVQQRTYSLLQQNNTKLSHNIETNRKKMYVNPWHTSVAKVVEKVTIDKKTSNVKRVPEVTKIINYTLEQRKEQKYNDRQADNIANQTEKNGMNQYSRKRFYHVNPPASVYTQIETFSGYKPVYAYDLSDTFFWGSNPKQGDYFLILLKSPQNISRIFIDSGSEGKESDILQNARLLISTRTPGNEERACQKLGAVALFVDGDIDTKISNISLPVNIDCITIEITANQNDWIIIREIAVFLSGELESSKLDQITSSPQMGEERKVLVQTFKRNETLKRLFVSKQSLGSVQTKNPDSIKSQWQDPHGHTDSRHSNSNQPKESLDRRPYASPNHRQINVHDANDAKNRSETLFKNGYAIDRNKLLKNGRHHRYQPTSDSRFNNSEDKRVQRRTYSLLQQNNTKLSHNIETNRKEMYVNPWHTSVAKVVEKVTIDKKTSNVQRVPEVTKISNYTLEHRKEQKYNDRQADTIANKTEKNGRNQYSRKRFYHVNPPATIHTQIETFSGYKPVYAYDLSDTFFWGSNPKQGDYFLILLKSPQNISRIFIDSGSEGKESDILQNARLLISTRTSGNEERACQNFGAVALFVNGDVDTKISNISLPVNIDCIAIEITANQNDWIIIREIAVFLLGELENEELDKNVIS